MEVGATVAQVDCPSADGTGMPPHSWSQVGAEKFLVRRGPNYSKNKVKSPSSGSFYELRAMDWYKGTSKVDGVATRLAAAGLPEAEFSHPYVPSLLVVNVQLPLEVRAEGVGVRATAAVGRTVINRVVGKPAWVFSAREREGS